MQKTAIAVIHAKDRFHTRIGWLDSWHSFSFGEHWDPGNTHHGLLVVSNDDIVRPDSGFGFHPHRDMEIVTWVLDGKLEHRDSTGAHGVLYPGLAQRMSAGSGILHSEMNPDKKESVRLVQMWVVPDARGVKPGYEQVDVKDALAKGGLIPVASGKNPGAAVSIHQKGATLWAGRLRPGERVAVPEAPFAHVFIAKGQAELQGAGPLQEGDAARLSDAGAPALAAGPEGSEVLIWEMDSEAER